MARIITNFTIFGLIGQVIGCAIGIALGLDGTALFCAQVAGNTAGFIVAGWNI